MRSIQSHLAAGQGEQPCNAHTSVQLEAELGDESGKHAYVPQPAAFAPSYQATDQLQMPMSLLEKVTR